MQPDNKVLNELEGLRATDPTGMLRPEKIVQEAENPNSPLHSYFTWDDDEAAHKWRINQALHLIRSVQVFIEPLNIRVRAYTSLDSDREAGNGFRSMTEVIATPDLRVQLLSTALRELQSMESRYAHLNELANVWEAAHGIDVIKPSKRVALREKKQAAEKVKTT